MAEEIDQLIEKAAAELKAAGARQVFVFGSAVKGVLHENSDLDFAVTGLAPQVFFRALARAARIVRRPVDLIDLDEESPFAQYLKSEGELRLVG